jgi:hypothetical protein
VDQVIQSEKGPHPAGCDPPRKRLNRRRLWPVPVVLAGFWIALSALPCLAQSTRASETEVEAAYLFNFGKFADWPPAEAGEAFKICVLGRDPFGQVLDATVTGESIASRPVIVARISNIRDAAGCQVLFISDQEKDHLRTILTAVRSASVLTVSDMPHFADRGGIIEFVEQEGRIRFEVNLAAAKDAKLTLSSELLKVAIKVIGKSAVEDSR